MSDKVLKKSIEKYESDSIISESTKGLKTVIKIIIAIFIYIIILTVYSITSNVYRINVYAGHICLLLFTITIIYFFIYPIYKLTKMSYFILDYNHKTIKKVKKHNEKVIISMAKNIINFSETINDEIWYDKKYVNELKTNLDNKNIIALRESMTQIINTSIRKKSNELIVKWAVKTGVLTALSQSDVVDSVFVLIINLLLVKDLVFLYGFRYSFFRLLKTFIGVFVASATAYSLQNANIGKSLLSVASGFLKKLGRNVSLPASILTSAIEIVTDSGMQGIGNAVMTAFIGYQTIAYLDKEYKLQDELENIDLLDEEYEFKETMKEINDALRKELKNVNYKNNKN